MVELVLAVLFVVAAAVAFAWLSGGSERSAEKYESGVTHVVPEDYPTIQKAVNAAGRGDVVVVKPGRYIENVDLSGKSIRISSEDPQSEHTVKDTIIDGGNKGPAIQFHRPPQEGWAVVEGFTLTGGTGCLVKRWSVLGNAARAGGGVYVGDGCSPLIRHNRIEKNTADMGGGLYIWGSSCASVQDNVIEDNCAILGGGLRTGMDFQTDYVSTGPTGRDQVEVVDCRISCNKAHFGGAVSVSRNGRGYFCGNEISQNIARWDGGGMSIWDGSSPKVTGNAFRENCCGSNTEYGFGGGISVVKNCRPQIVDNQLTGNRAEGILDSGGGGISVYRSSPEIKDNELRGNSASRGEDIYAWSNSEVTMKRNTVSSNGVVVQ